MRKLREQAVSRHEEAISAYNAGDYPRSLRLFEEITRAGQGGASALVGLGLSRFKLGMKREAIDALEASLRLPGDEKRGDEFLARKFLAFAYYEGDDIRRSLDNAERGLAIRMDPELERLRARLALEKSARREYVGEETFHFRVLFDGREHSGLGASVKEMLEDAYGEIGSALGHFPGGTVTVILYTERDFRAVTGAGGMVGGAYDGKIRLAVRGAEGNEDALRKVVYHEYAHAVIHSITPRCPLWLNEGLAEYLSGDRYSESEGGARLADLEKAFPSGPAAMRAAYATSYLAVSRLVERHGLYAVRDFLLRLARGEDTERAFSSAFFVSYREFLSDWDRI
ncbi:MAG: hypothetical protein Kow0025_05480 [Thermodesulfovibrionales bacterium]